MIFLEGYMEFLVTSQLNLTQPLFTSDGEILSTITSVFNGIVSIVLIPCLTIYIIVRRKAIIHDEKFIQRYGIIFKDTDVKKSASFPFFFISRRLVYVVFAFYMSHLPGFQLMIMSYSSLAVIIYQG